MISVVVITATSDRDLAALLSALVPAAVDGLVREVLVADAGSSDAAAAICEDAGADVVADLAAALRRAKGDYVLALSASLRLRPGWDESVRRHLEEGGGPALLVAREPGLLERLTGPKLAGVLVRARDLDGVGDLADLRRHAGRAPILS
ncbi:cell wall biosynthesis glycosyltransferase [Phenylobacterium sp.]|uniref:cell wall biosynthesis glycosyltransferase n=1 Tax=Phenylobacterium sp. TaxID=1871053 RepID=UPI0025FAA508|nr:cell wall biosynthesis glycosyltransferase [Phenylobacterium sp.]